METEERKIYRSMSHMPYLPASRQLRYIKIAIPRHIELAKIVSSFNVGTNYWIHSGLIISRWTPPYRINQEEQQHLNLCSMNNYYCKLHWNLWILWLSNWSASFNLSFSKIALRIFSIVSAARFLRKRNFKISRKWPSDSGCYFCEYVFF